MSGRVSCERRVDEAAEERARGRAPFEVREVPVVRVDLIFELARKSASLTGVDERGRGEEPADVLRDEVEVAESVSDPGLTTVVEPGIDASASSGSGNCGADG